MKVIWTALALADLKHAWDYISDESPASAVRVFDRIESGVQILTRHFELGRSGRVEGTRELVITNTSFIMVYRVKEKRLEVLALIHTSRKWPDQF